MKKMTYVIIFCLGVAVTCLCNHVSLIKSAAAENPGKQKLLNQMAFNFSYRCIKPIGLGGVNGTICLDFYEYYIKLGGTNELIYYAMEEVDKKYGIQ